MYIGLKKLQFNLCLAKAYYSYKKVNTCYNFSIYLNSGHFTDVLAALFFNEFFSFKEILSFANSNWSFLFGFPRGESF